MNWITLQIPNRLPFALRIDGRVLGFTAGIAMLGALVAGLAPALKATRPNLATQLKNEGGGSHAAGGRWTLRDGLLVTPIAGTMGLVVAGGGVGRGLSP